jgi:hypothetical protein
MNHETRTAASLTASILGRERAIVGMVHIAALPGTPHGTLPVAEIARQAAAEATLLERAGFDAIVLENMHDAPYLLREVGPEIVAAMTAVAREVRAAVRVPLGIQVLAGANAAAVAIAHAAGLRFVRAEGFVFAAVADEGLIARADAGPLLRYRKAIGAEGVAILADLKKKHSAHAITADMSLAETAAAAEFFGADGVIVTGAATGKPTSPDDLDAARRGCGLPIAVGSGATAATVAGLLSRADAVIVGSDLKKDGDWRNAPDPRRVEAFVRAARGG